MRITLFLCFFLLAAGCCVAPFPHRVDASPVLSGRLVEAESRNPIPDVVVAVHGFSDTKTKSNHDGLFRAGPARELKWGYIITPALIHDFPGGCIEREMNLDILDDRYEVVGQTTVEQRWKAYKDGVVDVGDLLLKKKPQR